MPCVLTSGATNSAPTKRAPVRRRSLQLSIFLPLPKVCAAANRRRVQLLHASNVLRIKGWHNGTFHPQRQNRRHVFTWDLRIMFFSPGWQNKAGIMVVDQSARLHKGVTDSRTDKLETAFFSMP